MLIIIVAALSSCKTSNMFMEEKRDRNSDISVLDSSFFYNPEYQYRIRKDDKINISVWNQDELSVGSVYGHYNSNEVYGKWLMVDANGNIEAPKLGTINIIDKTVIEVKDTIRSMFTKWMVSPIVDVKVLNREITVLGEVKEPQVITVDKDQNTLLEMISKCEGFAEYANLKYIKILRQEGENVRVANVDLSKSGHYLMKNIQLHPGDVVMVTSKSNKEFDKRISNLIPLATAVTAAVLLFGVL